MLSKGDPDRQMVYYQAGIGTYTIPQIATPFYANLSKTIDMMLATNLNHHVMGGYEFLMEHCEFLIKASVQMSKLVNNEQTDEATEFVFLGFPEARIQLELCVG